MRALFVAALICAGAARAQEKAPPPKEPPAKELTQEDRELVKELALLEKLELVKNLELFEPEKAGPKPPPQQQP